MGLTILSLLLLCGTSFADLSSEYKNKASLTDDYKLYWTHNATSNVMQIAVEVKATGWVALAFTKEKSDNMENYDACLGFVSGNTKSLKVSRRRKDVLPLSYREVACFERNPKRHCFAKSSSLFTL